MSLTEQAELARGSFDVWLGKNNGTAWSFTNLYDAQKQSLVWIGVSVIFAASFW
jgi:lipoprotein signal peptidase